MIIFFILNPLLFFLFVPYIFVRARYKLLVWEYFCSSRKRASTNFRTKSNVTSTTVKYNCEFWCTHSPWCNDEAKQGLNSVCSSKHNYLSNWFCTYCKVIILFSVLISYWVLLVAFSVVTVRYKMLMVIFTVQEKSEHPLQDEFRCNCPHPARSVIYCDGLSDPVQGFVLQNNRRWYQLNFGQKIRITDPVRCIVHVCLFVCVDYRVLVLPPL